MEVIEEVGIVPDALVAEVGSPEMAATRGAVLPVGSQGNAATLALLQRLVWVAVGIMGVLGATVGFRGAAVEA